MTRSISNHPARRRMFFAAVASAIVALVWVATSRAQTATPSAAFQFATISGAGNTITASRVPVTNAQGLTAYKNITFRFDLDPNGNLSLAEGAPQIEDALPLVPSSFRAGKYIGPASVLNGKTPVFVDGPSALPGGATSWSLSSGPGADTCTFPYSATWYAGPLESNPVAARLRSAAITSAAWSYGVANGPGHFTRCSGGGNFGNSDWDAGTLIGVSQSGTSITIASFSNSGTNRDYPAPRAQITYRLEQPASVTLTFAP